MVDLSKLKEGDTVGFRCGGAAEVEEVGGTSVRHLKSVCFSDGCFEYYSDSGEMSRACRAFDIVEIIPAPFDWAGVRPGMAFETGLDDQNMSWFVGFCPSKEVPVFRYSEKNPLWRHQSYYDIDTGYECYERAPEHDIEVAG